MATEWPRISLREAGVSLIDCDHRTPAATEFGYPYVTIPQMQSGRLNLAAARRITREDFLEWTKKAKPQANDVVLSRRCNPGETAVVSRDAEFALGQNLVILRADGRRVNPEFLRWLVRGREWWDQVNKFINVGAVFDSLRCADVPRFELNLPPLAEQLAIAKILGALDDKIELNRRMNETLEAMARALFKSWFIDFDPVRAKVEGRKPEMPSEIGKLFPHALAESDLGLIPDGWSTGSIGDLCQRVAMGPFGSDIKTENFVEAGVPVVRGSNLKDGFVEDSFAFVSEAKADELRNANAFPNDIVITHRGTLGQVGLIPEHSRFPRYVVSQSQMLLSVDRSRATPLYLFGFLISPSGQHALLANTSQTGVPAIARPTTSVKAIQIVVPPMRVLERFDSIQRPLQDRREACTRESRTLAALRDTLLPKLISGEIRVKDAEKMAEAVA